MPKYLLRNVRCAITLLFCSVFSYYATAANFLACKKAHRAEERSIDQQIKTLRASLPTELRKPIVKSGLCTLRALKVGATMGTSRDFVNTVDINNAMDCLNLKLYEITMSCYCEDLGQTYDSRLEDDFHKAYSDVKKLEAKTITAGIKNPLIKKYVAEVTKLKDCVSTQTLGAMREIGHRIDEINSSTP